MSYLHALPTMFGLHLRVVVNRGVFVSSSVAYLPLAAVAAWIATQSLDSDPVAYISIGVVLLPMWQFSFFLSGWSLAFEFDAGTVDHTLVSRTPLPVVMFVKAMAHLAMTVPGALITFVTVQLISREMLGRGTAGPPGRIDGGGRLERAVGGVSVRTPVRTGEGTPRVL